jgi:hypothetical protein
MHFHARRAEAQDSVKTGQLAEPHMVIAVGEEHASATWMPFKIQHLKFNIQNPKFPSSSSALSAPRR